MRKKWKGAMVLFFLLGTSALLTGSFILYRTYEVDHFTGTSAVMGRVVDPDEMPVEGVLVAFEERSVLSDDDGEWVLDDVDEGLIEITFYKPGSVQSTITWFVYPISEIGDEIEGTANDISASFDIELLPETENVIIDENVNGTITMGVYIDEGSQLSGVEIYYSPSSTDSIALLSGHNYFDIKGNGTFKISLSRIFSGSTSPMIHGTYPPGGSLNITEEMVALLSSSDDIAYQGEDADLTVRWDNEDLYGEVRFDVISLDGKYVYSRDIRINATSNCDMTIPPGIYEILITGRWVRDRSYRWITLNGSDQEDVEIEVLSASGENIYENYSIEPNYTVAVTYLIFSILIFAGGILLRKRAPWGIIIVFALVGFLTWGLFNLILNINHIMTIILVILLIRMRKEYNDNRYMIRKARRIN